MVWFIFAFFTAFFDSIRAVSSKKSLENVDEYLVAWFLRFFSLFFLLPFFFFYGFPEIGNGFYPALIISGGLNVVTTVTALKALKYSDLSIVSPISTFTTLFLLITSPLILGEFPSIIGLAGLFLIVIGSYFLKIDEAKNGYHKPFVELFSDRGAVLMLFVAFLWSITSNFDKIGVQNSSPIFWVVCINFFILLVLSPIVLMGKSSNLKDVKYNFKYLIPVGIFSGITLVCQMIAIKLTLVVYVIALKRANALFSVLWGGRVFKEENIAQKFIGSVIMIAGAIIIAFS